MAFLDGLTIYPVKSIHGIPLQTSQVNQSGLLGDRRYMLINERGQFVTARKDHRLLLIHANHHGEDKLSLSFTDPVSKENTKLELNPNDFSSNYISSVIWKTEVQAQLCGENYDQWFSKILNKDVKLVYFGTNSERFASRRPEHPVAFADGYPFLIVSRASVQALNDMCPEKIVIEQFRPNLIVDDCEPYAEDSWQKLKIGDVVFESVKHCIRCVLTTISPDTAEKSPLGEPFKTLTKARMLKENNKPLGPTFGMNLVALNEGNIKLGDKVEVLEYRTPESY